MLRAAAIVASAAAVLAGGDMKRTLLAFIAALALPALAWAGSGLHCKLPCGDNCPIPCDDCPLSQR